MLVGYLGCLAALAGSTVAQRPPYSLRLFPDCVNGPLAQNKICDHTLDPQTRAKALVAALTEAEKIDNMQDKSPGSSRLGLPAYIWWNEALHGLAWSPGNNFSEAGQNFSYATSFPQPITVGAAFNDDLVYEMANVVSTEARAFSNAGQAGLNFWTPNINPFRDPRWGRGSETPGEDPFHVASYVAKLIPGLQGPPGSPYMKVAANCKHFAGYDLELWDGIARYAFDAKISPQELRDYFLPPFQSCARDADVQSVMCAYNAVNGVPSCANSYLLQTILREHWDWEKDDRYVVGDCDAVHNIFNASSWNRPEVGHNYTKTPEEAAAVALNAGTDLSCGDFYPNFLPGAIDKGLTKVSTMDISLVRRYTSLITLGYFDSPENQPYRHLKFSDVSTPSAQALALQAAEEGLVLLKNDGTLPLSKAVKKLALIGPFANATTSMQGGYFGVAPYIHSPLWAAQKAGYEVTYVVGTDVEDGTSGYADALAAAKKADAVIYLGGINGTVEKESLDRYQIDWPANQLELISQLSALSKPFVVVQMGSMVDSAPLVANKHVNALVWAGYPGQDGGLAIFNVLTGKVAPAGRLPVTQYPAKYVDEVPMTNMSLKAYSSTDKNLNNPGRTYKFYTGTPTFPFGHGLHYTNFSTEITKPATSTFEISNLVPKANQANTPKYLDQNPFLTLPITIHNTGSKSSPFVTLLFLSGQFGPAPHPIKSLVGYQRTKSVAAGQSATVHIPLTLASLARADEKGNLVLYPGNYRLAVDVDGKVGWDFTLTGTAATLDVWPTEPKA